MNPNGELGADALTQSLGLVCPHARRLAVRSNPALARPSRLRCHAASSFLFLFTDTTTVHMPNVLQHHLADTPTTLPLPPSALVVLGVVVRTTTLGGYKSPILITPLEPIRNFHRTRTASSAGR